MGKDIDIWTNGHWDVGTISLLRELSKYIQITKKSIKYKKTPNSYIQGIYNMLIYIIWGKKRFPLARVRIDRVQSVIYRSFHKKMGD